MVFRSLRTTRFKTTLWFAGLFLTLEILLGLIIYWYLFGSLNQKLDNSLIKQASAIYTFFNESKKDFDNFIPDSIYTAQEELVWDIIYEALVYNKRNTYIQIHYNNKLIFKTANLYQIHLDLPKGLDSTLNLFNLEEKRISNTPIRCVLLNKDKYSILVAFPIENIVDTLKSFTTIYLIIAPIFFVISLIGGFLISKKSLSRINSIIKKTEEITAHNLAERIPGGEYKDEYGNLVRKMNEMIERIQKSIEYMNNFSISASHELKTPLTILRGEIEIALRTNKTIEEYRQTLESNYEEVLRLSKIIDNLFFVSRMDHSLIKLDKKSVNIATFISGIINNFIMLAKEKNISIIYNGLNDFKVNIDVDLMRQAIFNLLENAIKYSFNDTQIEIKTEASDKNFSISVINTGVGIKESDLNHIFSRFYRTDASRDRKTGGVGLGLSVVKTIVELHSGQITVNSELNKKTIFKMVIPF